MRMHETDRKREFKYSAVVESKDGQVASIEFVVRAYNDEHGRRRLLNGLYQAKTTARKVELLNVA